MLMAKGQNRPLCSNPKKETTGRAVTVTIIAHLTGSVKIDKMQAEITSDLLSEGLIISRKTGQILETITAEISSRIDHPTLPKGMEVENSGHLWSSDLETDHASKDAGCVVRGDVIHPITIHHHRDHHPAQTGIMGGRQEIVPKLHHLANSGTEMTAIGLIIAVSYTHLTLPTIYSV